jgi:hypothetical protein
MRLCLNGLTRRAEAQRLNRYRFDTLQGPTHVYTAVASGHFARMIDDDELPVPRELSLKVGTRVMFTVNDPKHRWSNGSLATVIGLEDDGVILQDETGEFRIEPYVWEKVRFALRSGQLSEETTDEYRCSAGPSLYTARRDGLLRRSL